MLGYDYSKFNWKRPLTRNNIDITLYNRKFELADKVFMQDKNPHPKVAQALLQDKTIRIYLKFRIDNKPVKLYPFQDLIINDLHRFRYFRAANQIGKSILLDVEAADNLTMDHGKEYNCAIVSASIKQASFQMMRIKDLLHSAKIFDWKFEKGETDNMSMVTWDVPDESKPKDKNGKYSKKYTNRVIIVPAGEGILGFPLDDIYLDEFEFWTDIDHKWFVNQLAEPRTYHTKGRIMFTTNPNGADTYGAVLENLCLPSGEPKYHTYVFNYLDKPGNTKDDLEMAKLGKTRAEIESTLLAIRSISDRNYFTPDEIERSYDKTLKQLDMVGKQSFFFLDVGAKHDASVLVGGYIEPDDKNPMLNRIYVPIIHRYPIGYPLSRVVGSVDAKQDSDGWYVEKSVKQYLKEWSVDGIMPVFGCDVTGNSGIVPLFNSVSVEPQEVTFSGPVKSGMYQRFKYYMEKGLIHRIKHEQFDYEAAHLEMRKSQRGYLLIHHENENDRDDIMDSFAGLIHLADPFDNDYAPANFEVI